MQVEAAQPDLQQRIEALGTADIVIGIPSFNNAGTIGHVVSAANQGLRRHFPEVRSVIVNADGGSSDGTVEAALKSAEDGQVLPVVHEMSPVEKLSPMPWSVPGKGSAIHKVFELARRFGAKACVVIEPDLHSITPEWIGCLVDPVLKGSSDFVVPDYVRHKFDGTITKGIAYPMMRALYGKRLRQPIGGEFCCSQSVLQRCLSQDVWETDMVRLGIEIWLTTEAVCSGARLCQVVLGPKVQEPKDGSLDLSGVLAQVLGALYSEMDRNAAVWQKVRGSTAIMSLGGPSSAVSEPAKADVRKMIESFQLGCRSLVEIWSRVLPADSLVELRKRAQRPADEFRITDALWAHIVYDFAVAHHFRSMSRDHLLRSFTPLYLGWVASFVMEMERDDAPQMNARIEKLCLEFETQKPYLISRWRWPDRF